MARGIESGNIITSEQTITGSWVDLGNEINVNGYSYFKAFLNIDINDSENIQFRFVDTENSSESYEPRYNIKANKTEVDYEIYELKNDEDQIINLYFDLKKRFNTLKLQVKALTVGSTAGKVLTATYRQGYSN